jgi:CRISPR-associated exonuclease Cas4
MPMALKWSTFLIWCWKADKFTKKPIPEELQTSLKFNSMGLRLTFSISAPALCTETKRGRAIEMAHISQLQYYLFKLWNWGVKDATGIIEYPELPQKAPG